MNEPLVSIIIPVYKVEAYLRKCVDSVLGQTYQNLEVILVDDGSPDNCGLICDAYAQQDVRVRTIHKVNAGVAKARNTGLDQCTGEYIMFLDSDDYLCEDAIEMLVERILADGSNMAVGKHTDVYEDGRTNDTFCQWMKDSVVSGKDILSAMGDDQRMAVVLWAKLYRKDIFTGLRLPELKCGEDLWVFPQVMEQCSKVSVVDHVVLCYLQRSTSIMHKRSEQVIYDDICAGLHFVQFLWKYHYQKSARRWFAICFEKMVTCSQTIDTETLCRQFLSQQEVKALLRGMPMKQRVKYQVVRNPWARTILWKVKGILKRG